MFFYSKCPSQFLQLWIISLMFMNLSLIIKLCIIGFFCFTKSLSRTILSLIRPRDINLHPILTCSRTSTTFLDSHLHPCTPTGVPISYLDPVVLEEGQSFRVAASCRAVGHPPPTLSWDTDLTGQSTNRTLEGGPVSSYFSLHPLRNMNGQKLDCLVHHPALDRPRRISNNLVVHCKYAKPLCFM